MDKFTKAYLDCALWSSNGDDEEPLDNNYSVDNFEPDFVQQAQEDCEAFQADNAELLAGLDPGQCGHDFWLTRNGHGTGFWDRGYPTHIGDKLTDAAHDYGGVDISELGDGTIG